MLNSVCMVVHSYCPDDPRVRREAEALVAIGTRVDVICLRNEGESAREKVGGVNYIRLPVQRKRGGLIRYLFEYGAFSLLAFFRASQLALQRKYDLFQAHNMPDTLVFCGLLHRLRGAKIVLDLHDLVPEVYIAKYDIDLDSKVVRFLSGVEAFSIAAADLAITTSIAFRNTLIERGIPPEKVRIILNAPDEAIFPEVKRATPFPANGRLRLIFHGTVVQRSGLDLAIRAISKLKEEIPEITLDVIGGGDAIEDCKKLVAQLSLGDAVTFHGQRPIVEVPDHVKRADFGIIPNHRNVFTEKNLPTRIFEYLRMRKPVITSRTPGVEDYFGEDGLLYFKAGNTDDLAEVIRAAYNDPERVRKTMRKGFDIYGQFRWSEERKRYSSLFQDLVDGNGTLPNSGTAPAKGS